MKKRHAVLALTGVAIFSLAAMSSVVQSQDMKLSDIMDIHGIAFDPNQPGMILIASHDGLYRGSPTGSATAVSSQASDYMGFSPDPVTPGRILASGHPSAGGNTGVIVSEDGGGTWTQLAPGVGGPVDFHGMAISRADPETIYGLYGDIQISHDGGVTWLVAGSAPGRIIDIAASPTDATTVYAGAVEGLMRSTDAGKTWALIGPANLATTLVEATADGSVYAFFPGPGLFRLSPADGKWSQLASDFGSGYLLHLAADPADPAHLVAATEKSAIVESRDGGMTWKPFGS